jgi:HNH endonuclease
VSADTLLGTGDEPGELAGHGPLTAPHARTLAFAPGSRWRWLLNAGDGTLIHASPRTYTPTHAVARYVRLRDHTCAFPHCTMPAARCDLDHKTPFNQGGPTTPDNLHPLCRHHHQLKTQGRVVSGFGVVSSVLVGEGVGRWGGLVEQSVV